MILVRAVKPGKPFQSSIFRTEIDREMESLSKDILDDFARTTKTWKHKPKFKKQIKTVGTQSITVSVTTDDKIYQYVDQGTKPHIIRPRKKKALAFRSKYKAKTEPKVILSTPGGASGETLVRPEVHHPGTEARDFTKIIQQSYKKEFRRRAQNALDRAARRFANR